MSLMDMYKTELKKSKDVFLSSGDARTSFGFRTGIDLLDYRNGRRVKVRNGKSYLSLGIDEGSYIAIIGRPGSGKTALAIQMAKNIVEPYEDGIILHYDIEKGTNETRIANLTGWDIDTLKQKYSRKVVGITHETFFESLTTLSNLKVKNMESLSINTGVLDMDGNEIMILPPTVAILDSLALLAPKNIAEDEDFSGQMAAAAIARANSTAFKRILPFLIMGNIILIAINHINKKIEINPRMPTKAIVNYLGIDETVPGGNTAIYLADNIIKLDPGSKLKEEDTFGFDGFLNKATLIKSRSNKAGKSFELVFDQERGFNNDLSNYMYLKGQGKIKGASRSFYLESAPNIKFAQKDFLTKLKKEKELRVNYKKTVKEIYRKFIKNDEEEDFETSIPAKEDTSKKKKKTKKK
jgi:ABC-type dipeptide/oligopeptide/nickel transport system ATPase subunit